MGGADRAGGKAKPLKVRLVQRPLRIHMLTLHLRHPKKRRKKMTRLMRKDFFLHSIPFSVRLTLWNRAHKAKMAADAKARKEMADKAKGGKGPLNTGQQGIKKSGKK
jgi:hypothetical protein